jgi:nucleotide-binding universal stress UspA family protein
MDNNISINVKRIPNLGKIDWLLAYDASESSLSAFKWILGHMQSHENLKIIRIIKRDKADSIKTDLEALKLEAQSLGFNNVDYVIFSGDAKHKIHDITEKSNAVNLVMGSRGHSRMRRFFLGSTSDYIVSNLNLTTVIVPSSNSSHDDEGKKKEKAESSSTSSAGSKWMVCVDGSEASYLALKWALAHVRNKNDEDLYIASVISDEHSSYEINDDKCREHKSSVMESHTKLVSACKEEVKRCGMTPLLLEREGKVRETLNEWITTYEIDNLVVGRRGMSNMKRLFVGSTSQYLASSGLCNVIVVKSDPGVPCCSSPIIAPETESDK